MHIRYLVIASYGPKIVSRENVEAFRQYSMVQQALNVQGINPDNVRSPNFAQVGCQSFPSRPLMRCFDEGQADKFSSRPRLPSFELFAVSRIQCNQVW